MRPLPGHLRFLLSRTSWLAKSKVREVEEVYGAAPDLYDWLPPGDTFVSYHLPLPTKLLAILGRISRQHIRGQLVLLASDYDDVKFGEPELLRERGGRLQMYGNYIVGHCCLPLQHLRQLLWRSVASELVRTADHRLCHGWLWGRELLLLARWEVLLETYDGEVAPGGGGPGVACRVISTFQIKLLLCSTNDKDSSLYIFNCMELI